MTPNMSSFRLFSLTFFVFLALSLNTASVYAQFDDSHIRAVDASSANCGDGTTWNTAYRYLQDALAFASNPQNGIDEIWVVTGTYYPDQDCANPDGTGLREATFLLDFNNVHLLGGFPPGGGDLADRDPAFYETVLSGDITSPWEDECAPDSGNCFDPNNGTPGCDDFCGGDPPDPCPGCCTIVCEIDPLCCLAGFEWTQACVDIAMDNCTGGGLLYGAYHVVTANSVDASTLLDGFTITQGSASGGPLDASWGGGMLITDSSLSIVRCLITGNSAPAHGGGAMHIQGNSNPLLVNCSLTNNNGGQGGAIHTEFGDIGPTLVNCLLADNFTTFVNPNTDHGGAIDHGGGSPQNPMVLINCTIVNNDGFEGAIYLHFGAHIIIVNSVLWNPGTAEIFIGFQGGSADVTYSDVEGGWAGEGNIDEDPLFVAAGTNYRLNNGSPCIDAADNDAVPCDEFDIDHNGLNCLSDPIQDTPDLDLGKRRIDDPDTIDTGNGFAPIVDMGTYEFCPPNSCPWDLDGGGFVGAGDLLLLLASWGNPYGASDLLALLADWGACP